ncbi:uncharacterized protein LOC122403410 [Colletes gigas]|uniref:uncharacterized protein LOC122403410 n=1 Tax=Colletes gigas TaxID=935657 RepID=UPI001C9B3FA8|nr:uncharacterized protein LOC122403410 [Colletes gigas]
MGQKDTLDYLYISSVITHKTNFMKMLGEVGNRFVIILFLLAFCCHRTSSQCVQLTPCSCTFSDGQGYNLTELGNSGFLTAHYNSNTVYFNPCKNVRLSDNKTSDCYNTSLCLETANKTVVNLGTMEETKIKVQPLDSEPVLTIHHKNYTTKINLRCLNVVNGCFTVDAVVNNNYYLTLISPHACKVQLYAKGLSTGSVLVILFIIFTGIYFIGGVIALKLLRGATGWEMIPNHEFWGELPSLIRDGITFTFSCCREGSYDRI